MRQEDIVELSQRLVKEREFFKFETKLIDVTTNEPDVKHREDVWYVGGEVTFSTHVGNHIEAPYHHLKTGTKVADLPCPQAIRQPCGPRLLAQEERRGNHPDRDRTGRRPGEEGRPRVHPHRPGPALRDEGLAGRSPRYTRRPHRLAHPERKIACFGGDAATLEVPGTDHQPVHTALFNAGIPMVESLTNLRAVRSGEYMAVILPLPIVDLESSPVRVIAVKKEALRSVV